MNWNWRKTSQAPTEEPALKVHVLDDEKVYNIGKMASAAGPAVSLQPHVHPVNASLFDLGIFKDTLAPSLALHSGLSIVTWGVARATDRVDVKDVMWPTGLVLNAWWSSIGRRVVLEGRPLGNCLATLAWPERLLLAGVSIWGVRLIYHIASRALARGADNPRYAKYKAQPNFWTKALVQVFIPEALFQTLISLPFTAPFRHQGAVMTGYHPSIQALAVGIFSAGFALEALADYQQDAYKQGGGTGLMTDGVWSIVRHPNYLGDVLMHAAFPVLLYGSDMLAPLECVGPIANYLYLRYFGGDSETEVYMEEKYAIEDPVKKIEFEQYKQNKNSFWPDVQEFQNQWTWIVVGCGFAGVALDQAFKLYHHS